MASWGRIIYRLLISAFPIYLIRTHIKPRPTRGNRLVVLGGGGPFLLTMTTPLDHTNFQFIKSKASKHLVPAVINSILYLKNRGVRVVDITVDCESSIVANKEATENATGPKVMVILLPPDHHAKHVQRKIRVVKEQIRCVLYNLEYQLPTSWHRNLMSHVISQINRMPTNPATRPCRTLSSEVISKKKSDVQTFRLQIWRYNTSKAAL